MIIKAYDIETLAEDFSITVANPDFTEVMDFMINEYQNDLYKLVKFIQDSKVNYWVGFNNIRFDAPVVTFIMRHYEEWYDLLAKEIAGIIYKFTQKVIENSNYDLPPFYKENELFGKQIDLFKIHHYDNKARRCSLIFSEQ